MKVVILDHTAVLGGGELALLRLCDAIDRRVVDVTVVLFGDGELRARLESIGVDVQVVPLISDVASLNRYAAGRISWANVQRAVQTVPFMWRLLRVVREMKPDIVQTNTLKSGLIWLVLAPAVRRPWVWYVHDRIAADYLPPRLVRLLKRVLRLGPTRLLANSHATADTLAPQPCRVVYPGFAPEQAIADADRPRPLHRTVVGLIGRISPTKGQLEFVRAAAVVLRSRPEVTFRVIGSPMFGADDYAGRIRAEVASLGIEDVVEFTGFVSDPLEQIDQLSVLVHASPVPEPFGQVIVEAMIRGVPVIATRGGGATEIVDPDPAAEALGILVPPGASDALAAAICEVIENPADAERRARDAHRSALERFSIERTAAEVTDEWREVLGRRASRGPSMVCCPGPRVSVR